MGIIVTFTYFTGLPDVRFSNAWLQGTWNEKGLFSEQEIAIPMKKSLGEDDCPMFQATARFDPSEVGKPFRWRVVLDAPGGPNAKGITTEVHDHQSSSRFRTFTLAPLLPAQEYYLIYGRRLGANKFRPSGAKEPGIRFSVWAPNARKVEVVMVEEKIGYVTRNGTGVTATFPMSRNHEGIWDTDFASSPGLKCYADFVGKPYYFKVTKDNDTVAFRTDLYSRQQIGRGDFDPKGEPFNGLPCDLDGRASASVIIDPDMVGATLDESSEDVKQVPAGKFWRNEFNPLKPLPSNIQDLIIYQLHVGALGFGKLGPGNLKDAIEFLDYLEALNINAIELLPINEFAGNASWGYGTSHFFAIEQSAGGRDHLKHFIRECHRRGIAVILDVVYNHFSHEGERAQWQYDSDAPERNIWYWYEGLPSDYPTPDGGYIDNISTGYAPRFCEEQVRKCFISSAISLATEFHVDGFRMDQVTSLHSYAVLHANGAPADHARQFGIKFLREWNRTLKLIKPSIFTHAEDHSLWPNVTMPTSSGGLGFDAFWYADFYHHLVGGSDKGSNYAKLIRMCGEGNDRPQAMDYFAAALSASANDTVVYSSVHDHAGNAEQSARNIVLASNHAPLIGDTRRYAEARCRFAFGMTILSAGTPLFFMGDEVGAAKKFTYDAFLENREDLYGLRNGSGAGLFRFYQDLIRFSRRYSVTRSQEIDVFFTRNEDRVIAFRRWQGRDQLLVIGTLSNQPFAGGYTFHSDRLPKGQWKEVFNSDAVVYGGWNIGNGGEIRPSDEGQFTARLPACGLVIFNKVG